MTIEFHDMFDASPGVHQLPVSLGRGVQMPLSEAIALFRAVPGVKDAGAIGGMWPRGHIDLQLDRPTLDADLRFKLVGVCQQILAAG